MKVKIDTARIVPVHPVRDWAHYGAGHRYYFESYITRERIYAVTKAAAIQALQYETEREQSRGDLMTDAAADGFPMTGGNNVHE